MVACVFTLFSGTANERRKKKEEGFTNVATRGAFARIPRTGCFRDVSRRELKRAAK